MEESSKIVERADKLVEGNKGTQDMIFSLSDELSNIKEKGEAAESVVR